MLLNKPRRLVAVLNGFEIGVESPSDNQDAASFDKFCEAFRLELFKLVEQPKEATEKVVNEN